MGMVVRTNMGAINATRNLNKNQKGQMGSLEKLASGFKINRAADDASGLSISEKMKAQIKALNTASENAANGQDMISTAEGYLNEVHDMLNRMVELAMKSANGTFETANLSGGVNTTANSGAVYGAGTDRNALQSEMNQLCAEIDRIADTANFNNVKLFDGSMATKDYSVLGDATSSAPGAGSELYAKYGAQSYANAYWTTVGAGSAATVTSGLVLQVGETSSSSDRMTISIKNMSTKALFYSISTYKNMDGSMSADASTSAFNILAWNDKNTVVSGGTQVVNGYTLDISGQNRAALVAEALRGVINGVSEQRSELGAMSNRLDYTINNLDTASENISSANSRIRDTDVAKEMTKYTQFNILSQAAQSMLAQANQQPQAALQLMG